MSSQRNLFYSNLWQWLRQNVIPISCWNCRNIGRSEQKSVRVRIEMDSEFMSSLALDHTQQREMSNENLISNLLFCIEREPWCSDPGRGWINWIRNKNQMNDNKERMNAATDEGVYLIHRWCTAGMLPPAAVRDWGVRTELLHAIPSPAT